MKITPLQKRVLVFLREEVFSTAFILRQVVSQNSIQATHQLLARLVKRGLLSVGDIHVFEGRILKLYGITEKGQSYAWSLDETPTNNRTFQPSKVAVSQLQHELDMQLIHLCAEQNGWSNWQNAKNMGKRLQGAKYPDAIATAPDGSVHCIEIEREIKSTSRCRQIMASHLAMRKAGLWDTILYLSPNSDLATRVRRKFHSLGHVNWRGHRVILTDAHLEHFQFEDYRFFERKSEGVCA